VGQNFFGPRSPSETDGGQETRVQTRAHRGPPARDGVGDGGNIWGETHEFHFVYGRGEPPVRLEARIVDLDHVSEYSKAGLAVRGDSTENAPFGYVGVTGDHGPEVTWREAVDGFTGSDQFEGLAGTFEWFRVEYVDGVVTCSLSVDGEEWHLVDQRALDLGPSVALGLVVCSHSTDDTAEAVFEDVRASELDVN
jgi:hypothetical protein